MYNHEIVDKLWLLQLQIFREFLVGQVAPQEHVEVIQQTWVGRLDFSDVLSTCCEVFVHSPAEVNSD